MTDEELVEQINRLAEEEHELERSLVGKRITESEVERLHLIEARLDQIWDLLRQRRARRDAGLNPDEAKPRPIETVEHYRQ